MARETLHRDLPEIAKDYDHCAIDTAHRVSALARSAILASDLTLIPVQPSSYDVWAAAETVALIKEAQQFKPEVIKWISEY
ncbi:MAG: AAA family ATPase [Chamaesiphon sp.]|nr:AAA family ATPase [Chamaesiphon sp.]